MSDLERNKAVTRAMYEEVWRDHRVERLDEIMADDVVLHVWGDDHSGLERMHHIVENVWLAAFPDLFAEVHVSVAEGDLVADHATFRGTHTGAPFHGLEPSGARFAYPDDDLPRRGRSDRRDLGGLRLARALAAARHLKGVLRGAGFRQLKPVGRP
jgi:predicted ester cyclase